MTDTSWETLSNQAIAAAGVVYFLALMAHLVEWSALRTVPVSRPAKVAVPAGAPDSTAAVASTASTASTDEAKTYRIELFGRLGWLLTIIAVAAHFVGL